MRLSLFIHSSGRKRRTLAFSLVELLVAMSLTGVIIIALYSVFNQTQKALRTAVKQVSVQELGAPAIDLLASELESAVAFSPLDEGGVNFEVNRLVAAPRIINPLIMVDGSNNVIRTNVIQDLYFLRRDKQQWVATLYRVEDFYMTNAGTVMLAGTLTRYTTNFHAGQLQAENAIHQLAITNFHTKVQDYPRATSVARVAERVVHFKVTTFDAQGRPYAYIPGTNHYTSVQGITRMYWVDTQNTNGPANVLVKHEPANSVGSNSRPVPIENAMFLGSAMPAAVEIEIGIVEPEAYEQYRRMVLDGMNESVTSNFLRTRPHVVHLFKKRIPIASGYRDERFVLAQ